MLRLPKLCPPHNVIITGTGRAGTTFLVRLLTELGLPTGYTATSWQRDYFEYSSAGLERKPTESGAPYIIKDPDLCVTLRELLDRREIVIDHALIPIRELSQAAASRIHIGGGADEIPGGLVGTRTPEHQRAVLAERFHQLVHTLAVHNVPHTFLAFPRFVQEPEYLFEKLRPVFAIDRPAFDSTFRRIADAAKIHHYSDDAAADAGIAAQHRAGQRRKKLRRRWRRAAGWAAVASLVGLAAAFSSGRWTEVGRAKAPVPPQ